MHVLLYDNIVAACERHNFFLICLYPQQMFDDPILTQKYLIRSVDILDDMLAGIGWTMQDYLKHGENDYYPPLSNGHRIFLHDIRRVAVRAAVAMGEEGDVIVSYYIPLPFAWRSNVLTA